MKKVVVAAPVKDADPVLNIVIGCNEVTPWTQFLVCCVVSNSL